MYRKLTDEQIQIIIDSGVAEFAHEGFVGANLSRIAKNAGVSVGVIYKYYADKKDLFLACVRYGLNALTDALKEVAFKSDNLEASIRAVVRTLINHSKRNVNINMMYNEITSGGAKEFAGMLAEEIEGISALVYTDLLRKAREEGKCRKDLDPATVAFFIDNLFMMLQFSYSCDYYKERLKLYLGADAMDNDELMEHELVRFICNALGM
jgi:AcrR family transcriptional regulator